MLIFGFLRLGIKLALLVVALVVAYLGVTFVQVWQASNRDGARPADAIVVLGAAQYHGRPSPVLQARLDHAVELYQAGIAPVLVVTGGRREGDRFTEASAAAGYLQARGVPADALLLETQGENSWQSLAAAARILRQRDLLDVVLVSSPYHALRTEQIAEEVGLRGRASPAEAEAGATPARIRRIAREAVAVGVGRLIGHRRLVDLDTRVGRVRTDAGTG